MRHAFVLPGSQHKNRRPDRSRAKAQNEHNEVGRPHPTDTEQRNHVVKRTSKPVVAPRQQKPCFDRTSGVPGTLRSSCSPCVASVSNVFVWVLGIRCVPRGTGFNYDLFTSSSSSTVLRQLCSSPFVFRLHHIDRVCESFLRMEYSCADSACGIGKETQYSIVGCVAADYSYPPSTPHV